MQRPSLDVGVVHAKTNLARFDRRVFFFCLHQFVFFFIQVYFANEAYGNGCSDDTQHAKWISAGIPTGYLWNVTICKNRGECLVSSSQAWSIGYSAIKRSYHHGQIGHIRGVEKDEITGKHHGDVEQNSRCGKHVEGDTATFETFKKARTYL